MRYLSIALEKLWRAAHNDTGSTASQENKPAETAEEIFCHGVVIGIAFAGHALANSIGLQALPEKAPEAYWTPLSL